MYQLTKHSDGSFLMISRERGLRWRITNATKPDKEANCRAAGAELDARQRGHAADGQYGADVRAWHQACGIVGVAARFAWTGIVNSLGDHGSVSPPVKPFPLDEAFLSACEIVADLIAPIAAPKPVPPVAIVATPVAIAPVAESFAAQWAREDRERVQIVPSKRIVGGTRRRRNARRRVNG